MQTTFLAEYTSLDGSTAYKIVRVFGKASVNTIRQTLEKHGVLPREIIRAPDKATLEQITRELTTPYQVMYMMGK